MQPNRKKTFLQKVATIFSILCFSSSVICALLLMFYFSDFSKVYRASFAATTFFFFTAGFVLKEMADTNLPVFQGQNTTESTGAEGSKND